MNANVPSKPLSPTRLAELKPFVQALVLLTSLRVPLQPEAARDLDLAHNDPAFRAEVEEALNAMSVPNEFGIQIVSLAQKAEVQRLLQRSPVPA